MCKYVVRSSWKMYIFVWVRSICLNKFGRAESDKLGTDGREIHLVAESIGREYFCDALGGIYDPVRCNEIFSKCRIYLISSLYTRIFSLPKFF